MTVCLSSDFTEVLLLELPARDRSGLLRRLDYGCKHLTQILLGTEFLLLLLFFLHFCCEGSYMLLFHLHLSNVNPDLEPLDFMTCLSFVPAVYTCQILK